MVNVTGVITPNKTATHAGSENANRLYSGYCCVWLRNVANRCAGYPGMIGRLRSWSNTSFKLKTTVHITIQSIPI